MIPATTMRTPNASMQIPTRWIELFMVASVVGRSVVMCGLKAGLQGGKLDRTSGCASRIQAFNLPHFSVERNVDRPAVGSRHRGGLAAMRHWRAGIGATPG